MNVSVRDAEVLKTIEPEQLKAYLQARGWYEDRPFLDNATIWLKQDASRGEFEILLPLKTTLGDYVARIREAIAILESAENRSQSEILSELLTKANNITIEGAVMQIHAPKTDQLSGTIVILGVVFDKLRKIQTELFNHDYILAIKAYQERLPITCTGDLIKEDSCFVLKNPRNLALDESWKK
jgi:hypothetical protein